MRLRKIAVSSLLGCSACNGEPTTLGNACEPSFSIVVSSTAAPEFTWQPDCSVATLHVHGEGIGITWQIGSTPRPDFSPTNDIRSGVVYGQVPAEALESFPAMPLEPGQMYQAFLRVTDSQGGSTLVGVASFTAVAE